MSNEKMLGILRFWRDVEAFSIPSAPKVRSGNEATRVTAIPLPRPGEKDPLLPWEKAAFREREGKVWLHSVFIGVADAKHLYRRVIQSLDPGRKEETDWIGSIRGNGWMSAFVVDHTGTPVPRTYVPASFAVGTYLLRTNQGIPDINDKVLDLKSAFADRVTAPEDGSPTAGSPAFLYADWPVIMDELDRISAILDGEGEPVPDLRIFIKSREVSGLKLDDEIDKQVDFMNSYFINDIQSLIRRVGNGDDPGAPIRTYLGNEIPAVRRIDILQDQGAMSRIASAENLPRARWPASPKAPLVMAQQAAVSHALHTLRDSEGIIGINGPPGTGKTTLLCDIIANVVVDRADRIANLKSPRHFFEREIERSSGEWRSSVFIPRAGIIDGTQIVVTSSNNNAVQNISQELPAKRKISDEFEGVDYFSDVMRNVFFEQGMQSSEVEGADSWGLMAATLGNAKNRRRFSWGFFRDRIDQPAKGSGARAGVTSGAEPELPFGVPAEVAEDEPQRQIVTMAQVLREALYNRDHHCQIWEFEKRRFCSLRDQVERVQRGLARVEAFRRGEASHRPAGEIRQDLHTAWAMGTRYYPDEEFWSLQNDDRHRISLVTNEKLDRMRADLFLSAMRLHKATILANADRFLDNLRGAASMIAGYGDKPNKAERCAFWDTLFFTTPVVSTTLASFSRLFSGVGHNYLGWLLVDEAGQATPQSTVGAIGRSRRVVAVGDPLQIEPVVTIPVPLIEILRKRHEAHVRWSPGVQSLQSLADRVTKHGSWVQQEAGRRPVWTGLPLRTHRRCDDPMFTIANRIAYGGQMVQGRVDAHGNTEPHDVHCPLGDSAWIDVRSTNVVHPVNYDEIDALLHWLNPIPGMGEHRPSVFVISPFKDVQMACEARLQREGLGDIPCGTVHAFQGREADIVFLVLGTAPGKAGAPARSWVVQRPNLLNVALTRAKSRIFVIGDHQQWSGMRYFPEITAHLPVLPFSIEPQEDPDMMPVI